MDPDEIKENNMKKPYAYTFFTPEAKFIGEFTEMLDREIPKLPYAEEFHLHIELRDSDGTVAGTWSDEIASDSWSFTAAVIPSS